MQLNPNRHYGPPRQCRHTPRALDFLKEPWQLDLLRRRFAASSSPPNSSASARSLLAKKRQSTGSKLYLSRRLMPRQRCWQAGIFGSTREYGYEASA
jgi:hypothetical protein